MSAPVPVAIAQAAFQLDPVTTVPAGPTVPASPAAESPLKPSTGTPGWGGVPSARPPGSGGGSGGSGAPVAAVIDREGVVLTALPGGVGRAVAGARVAADGLEAVTDGEGRFRLAGVRAAAALVVSAPGHVTSVVAGAPAEPLTLHLASGQLPMGRFEALIPVEGVVMRGESHAPAGVVVVGGNARGASFGPVVTDESGRFKGLATSYEGVSVADMALWACGYSGPAPSGLGLSEGVAIGPAAGPVQITLEPSVGEVRLAAEGPGGARRGEIAAVAGNGVAIVLGTWADGAPFGSCPYFSVPGATLRANVSVEAPDGRARSVWRARIPGPGTVLARLMPFPGAPAIGAGGLAESQAVAWSAPEGAEGYRVSLRAQGVEEALWEAYTPAPSVTLRALPAAAADHLEILALSGPAAGVRQVASVPARQLRWFDSQACDRFSSRLVPLAPPEESTP